VDQPTLLVSAATSIGLCTALLVFARPRRPELDALGWWAVAMALGTAGLVLMAAPLPVFVSRDLAKALLLLSGPASWTAARVFCREPPRPVIAAAGAVVWLGACRIPAFDASVAAQMTLTCAIGSAYTLATALALRHPQAARLHAQSLAFALLLFHAALYAIRAGLAATGWDGGMQEALVTILLLEAPLHTIGMAFVLVLMTRERAEQATAASLAEARQAADARRRFLAHMSHEVRTPLNGLLGLAQVLRRDPTLRADQRQHVETMEAAGRHLLAIVNDAIDLAKIDAGRFDIVARPFSPAAAAEACVALVRPAAVDKRINLRLHVSLATPPLVAGDPTRLQQIVLNLLWNAVKFTPDGGRVDLSVSFDQTLRVDVTDTGVGIPGDRLGQLFQDFSRLDPGQDGSGLGLAISSRLAERMGGRLTYQPGLAGDGSLFRLELPWREAEAPPLPVRPVAPVRGRGLTVLVVDDVPSNRLLLRIILASDGHTVVEARGGAEAVALAAQSHFDGILMDLRMPDLDGFEATRRIRALPGPGGQVKVIAVSADAMPATVRDCQDAGMVSVLTKPVDHEAVIAAVRALVQDGAAAPTLPATTTRV
jgi:signal transduction histidine kinase/ActR/RegA family two-component response regulator